MAGSHTLRWQVPVHYGGGSMQYNSTMYYVQYILPIVILQMAQNECYMSTTSALKQQHSLHRHDT
jgi:hypothetical protein